MSKILIVDDKHKNLKLLEALLEPEGYEVITALDGLKALKIVTEEKIDLILLDVMMPVLNGFEVTRRLKALEKTKFIPIVLITALKESENRIKGIEVGCDDFLSKPVDSAELIVRVRSLLKVKAYHDHMRNYEKELESKIVERTNKIQEQKEELEKLYNDLENAYMDSIRTFTTIIEFKSSYIGNHSKRVTKLVKYIAEQVCKDEREKKYIEIAALLHDVGKVLLEDTLLDKSNKGESLSKTDKIKYEQHVILGQSIVRRVKVEEAIGLMVRHHHENWDGTGYPDKIKQEAIPLGARIIAICDAYDTFINNTLSVKESTSEEVIEFLKKGAGSCFDPQILKAFIQYIYTTKTLEQDKKEIGIKFSELRIGMILSRDLIVASGKLLLSKDQEISKGLKEKIDKHQQTDPILEDIFIYRSSYLN